MKSLIYAVLTLLIFNQAVMADDKSAVEKLIKNKIDAVLAVLQKKDIEQQAKKEKILETVIPIFNFPLMARLTLGKKYWPGLAKDKKEKFKELFIKRLKECCLTNLTLYTNETVVFKEAVQVKKKIYIPTELISKDSKISLIYKLYKSKKNNWQIYDLEVQGVSIIQTYRTQFDQILDSGTIDDLLLKLENTEYQ